MVISVSDQINLSSLLDAHQELDINIANQTNRLREEENSESVSINVACTLSMQDKFVEAQPEKEHKYTQAKMKGLNKATNTLKLLVTASVGVQCKLQYVPVFNAANQVKNKEILNESVESISSSNLNSSHSNDISEKESSPSARGLKINMKLFKLNAFESFTKLVIEDDPLLFIGFPKDCMFVIDIIKKTSGISVRNIYFVLTKIRTNLSFAALSYKFGVCDSQLSRIFKTSIYTIAQYFKQLIHWPSRKDILLNMSIQFRFRYSSVNHIIDCFEIEIEKPSNALHQALTWSDYNTAKYLVTVTPDRMATFISKGACGRSTDMAIVENSGYLK